MMFQHRAALTPVAYQAKSQGFTLLSSTIANDTRLVTFWCKKFHRCTMPWTPGDILYCNECDGAIQFKDNNDVKYLVAELGLTMPEDYERMGTTHTWTCTRGHIFDRTLADMAKGQKNNGDEYKACVHCQIKDIGAASRMIHVPGKSYDRRKHFTWECVDCGKRTQRKINELLICLACSK